MAESPSSPVPLLRAHARHAPWNARGLAAHATSLVEASALRPTNAVARAEPSARAVRFYVASGLLDRPDGTGTAATYGYRHLLQILFIKIRQREGQTLEKIKAELIGQSGDALERRIANSLAPAMTLPHRGKRRSSRSVKPCAPRSPAPTSASLGNALRREDGPHHRRREERTGR
jgi:DNA-binding transcriptional MerR regulator